MGQEELATVLFLSANPAGRDGVTYLQPEMEARFIAERINGSHPRKLRMVALHNVTGQEFIWAVRSCQPTIVHFSGHGSKRGLVVLDEAGRATSLPDHTMEAVFADLSGIRCVVLNTCYAKPLAEILLPHVGCVIGIEDVVADNTAIAFSQGFYSAILEGESIASAVRLARIYALHTHQQDAAAINLYHRTDVDPETIRVCSRPIGSAELVND